MHIEILQWNSLYTLDFPEHFFLFLKHSVAWTESGDSEIMAWKQKTLQGSLPNNEVPIWRMCVCVWMLHASVRAEISLQKGRIAAHLAGIILPSLGHWGN